MMMHSHQTAPTQFVMANGIRFAYRRFGKTGGVPVVFNQRYIGTMDYWDPTVTDGATLVDSSLEDGARRKCAIEPLDYRKEAQ